MIRRFAWLFLAVLPWACRDSPPEDNSAELAVEMRRNGFPGAEWMPLDVAPFSGLGVAEAGILKAGRSRVEVYRAFSPESHEAMAGHFLGSGLVVLERGNYLVVVPDDGSEELVAGLRDRGFSATSSSPASGP